MELLNQIFVIIFYVLFITWILFKIKNTILIKKFNYKELYKNKKNEIKKNKAPKYLIISIIVSMIIFVTYLIVGIVIGGFMLFMMFLTFGGIMYYEAGGDPTFYNDLITFVGNYFSLLKYIEYYIYIIVYILLTRSIYINILTYKSLNDKEKNN